MSKNIFTDIIFIFLSWTWGIILTLIGLGFLLFCAMSGIISKVRYVRGRIGFTLNLDIGGASLGMFYFVGTYDSTRIRLHELGHTVQNIIWGPFILPFIAIPSIVRAANWPNIVKKEISKGKPYPDYDRIWFEGQATSYGNKYFNAWQIKD